MRNNHFLLPCIDWFQTLSPAAPLSPFSPWKVQNHRCEIMICMFLYSFTKQFLFYVKLTLVPVGPRCPSEPFTHHREKNTDVKKDNQPCIPNPQGNRSAYRCIYRSFSSAHRSSSKWQNEKNLTCRPGAPGVPTSPFWPLCPGSPGSPASPWQS